MVEIQRCAKVSLAWLTAGCGLTEVDTLCDQDADGDGQLEHDVELAANLGGRHLREVQRHTLGGQACKNETTPGSNFAFMSIAATQRKFKHMPLSPQDRLSNIGCNAETPC